MSIITLIVCTKDRYDEPIQLLNSLNKQSNKNFNIIIIDQNSHNKLQSQVENFDYNFEIDYIKVSTISGLSAARNIALTKNIGSYYCFPDDDCYYSESLINSVIKFIEVEKPNILSIPIFNHKDKNIIIKKSKNKKINKFNFWSISCSSSIFIKNKYNNLKFDENFGIGSLGIFQSGEDSDYIYNYMQTENFKGKYLFMNIKSIFHPEFDSDNDKIYRYALGKGGVLKKNKIYYLLFLDIFKFIVKILVFNFNNDKIIKSKIHIKGVLKGFKSYS